MNTDSTPDVRVWAFEKLLNRPVYSNGQGLGGYNPQPTVAALMVEAEAVTRWVMDGPEKPKCCKECGK